ncbi:MAG: hypothetical protein WAT33_13345, partial [Giesbergeria sp.]
SQATPAAVDKSSSASNTKIQTAPSTGTSKTSFHQLVETNGHSNVTHSTLAPTIGRTFNYSVSG